MVDTSFHLRAAEDHFDLLGCEEAQEERSQRSCVSLAQWLT